jgi:hypothetical protein
MKEDDTTQPANALEPPHEEAAPLERDPDTGAVSARPAQGIDYKLLAAVAEGNKATVERLLRDGANPSAYGKCGCREYDGFGKHSPLGLAARRGDTEIGKLLLQHGADVNGYTNGFRPLHAAIEHKDVVEMLVAHGADVNEGGNLYGIRPLHYAVGANQEEVVEFLLKHGADPNAEKGNGDTPMHIAKSEELPDMEALLLKYGANPPPPEKPPIKSRCATCEAEIEAVPGLPFQCPKCGSEYVYWHPPVHWISEMGEGVGDGRDKTACSYAKSFLEESEELQILVMQLNRALWTWEAAYRGASTNVMTENEDKAKRVRERIEQLAGHKMWFRACMAMPPHLRHVASSAFDTAGNYTGAGLVSDPPLFSTDDSIVYEEFAGEDSEERKAGLLRVFDQLDVGPVGLDMLMWRLANAVMDGESEEIVLDYLCNRIANGVLPEYSALAVLRDAVKLVHSSSEYFKPEFTNLGRFTK